MRATPHNFQLSTFHSYLVAAAAAAYPYAAAATIPYTPAANFVSSFIDTSLLLYSYR
jgi:hypothetical protein